jgi:glycosyltransferase involved in cell wall biosynthesis
MSGATGSYAALIPALDCASTIAEVVEGCLEHFDTVLVVDDGSRDATAEKARMAGAEVFSHGENLGKGMALRSGLEIFSERGVAHAVSLDGDGQHLPEEIPKLTAESFEHPGALVLGARPVDRNVAALNRFGNDFANLWVRIATGRAFDDTQCGLRVYPIAATLALAPTGRRFDFETEILIRAVRAGLEIRTVAVQVYSPPPELRHSHYDKLWDTVRIIEMVVGLMLRLR